MVSRPIAGQGPNFLKLPFARPETVEHHAANVRELERWANFRDLQIDQAVHVVDPYTHTNGATVAVGPPILHRGGIGYLAFPSLQTTESVTWTFTAVPAPERQKLNGNEALLSMWDRDVKVQWYATHTYGSDISVTAGSVVAYPVDIPITDFT